MMRGFYKMKKDFRKKLIITLIMFVVFAVFTVLVKTVDVQDIGPEFSKIGFAGLNAKVNLALGESEFWYKVTEALGIFSILVGLCFALLGVIELIKGKSLKAVDADIYALGGFYVLLGIAYVAFEKIVINYRPVLEDGELAASYPSSHTVLIVGIMITTALQLSNRLKGRKIRRPACIACGVLAAVAVIGRLLAGVHWFTDILGGVILAASLIMLYVTAISYIASCKPDRN